MQSFLPGNRESAYFESLVKNILHPGKSQTGEGALKDFFWGFIFHISLNFSLSSQSSVWVTWLMWFQCATSYVTAFSCFRFMSPIHYMKNGIQTYLNIDEQELDKCTFKVTSAQWQVTTKKMFEFVVGWFLSGENRYHCQLQFLDFFNVNFYPLALTHYRLCRCQSAF